MKKNKNIKKILLLAMIALILTCGVGGTLAYLIAESSSVTNTFTPSEITNKVDEDFEEDLKENVTVSTAGSDVDAYVRAAIVVTWQDKEGNINPTAPVAEKDYNITINEGTGTTQWTKSGSFYYYNSKVTAGASTENLIVSCSPVAGKTPAGYGLVVEILSSTIQAEPTTAVSEAWGFVPGSSN